ncbi:hypothetical protein [Campylobacter fetus]|uniref:hypothetical protein n=1 Tax=Campylobacter fetus TaxID=196 RepID=UPI000FC9F38D|nr:hypothetical protein [Campylobacter fetus]RUT50968.1 hypothetical protein BWK67_00145 [Campylobacter fetus]RUT51696.1 hypothetical protein BWK51_00145 [Campylobacter fetus]
MHTLYKNSYRYAVSKGYMRSTNYSYIVESITVDNEQYFVVEVVTISTWKIPFYPSGDIAKDLESVIRNSRYIYNYSTKSYNEVLHIHPEIYSIEVGDKIACNFTSNNFRFIINQVFKNLFSNQTSKEVTIDNYLDKYQAEWSSKNNSPVSELTYKQIYNNSVNTKIDLDFLSKTLNLLQNSILRRYVSLNYYSFTNTKNAVIDSLAPKLFIASRFNKAKLKEYLKDLPPSTWVISRHLSAQLGIRSIPIEDLCLMLGYTFKDISTLLKKVKAKQYNFTFIGFGGTGTNTAHWLTEMCEMCSVFGLFKRVDVFDKDTIEVSNTFRFPELVVEHNSIHFQSSKAKDILKHSYASNEAYNYDNRYLKVRLFTNRYHKALSKNKSYTYAINVDSGYIDICNVKTIFYGAPTIECRRVFDKTFKNNPNATAIYGLHFNNTCNLLVNPVYDESTNDLIESYGTIQLGVFFMNQIRMVIGLLEALASPDLETMVDKNYLEYSYLKETKAKKTRHRYNLLYKDIETIEGVTNV